MKRAALLLLALALCRSADLDGDGRVTLEGDFWPVFVPAFLAGADAAAQPGDLDCDGLATALDLERCFAPQYRGELLPLLADDCALACEAHR